MGAVRITKDHGSTYSPQGGQQTDDTRLPPQWANYPFTFVHYPAGWGYFGAELGYLPELCRITHHPGVNGVEQPVQGGQRLPIRTNRAYSGAGAKGGTLIRLDDSRITRSEWAGFLIRLPCVGNGFYHCFKSTEFVSYGPGMVEEQDTSAEFFKFRAFLRDQGIVGGMPLPVYNRLLATEQAVLGRLLGQDSTPLIEKRVAAQEAKIEAMKAQWLAMQSPSPDGASVATPKRLKIKRETAKVEIQEDK